GLDSSRTGSPELILGGLLRLHVERSAGSLGNLVIVGGHSGHRGILRFPAELCRLIALDRILVRAQLPCDRSHRDGGGCGACFKPFQGLDLWTIRPVLVFHVGLAVAFHVNDHALVFLYFHRAGEYRLTGLTPDDQELMGSWRNDELLLILAVVTHLIHMPYEKRLSISVQKHGTVPP